MTLRLTSPAFAANTEVPAHYTCEGTDVSPPLAIDGVPDGTKSLVLLVDDPDAPDPSAPQRVWVHWVVYDLPPTTHELPADAAHRGLPAGSRQGKNDWKRAAYGGPCPPIGRHRYFFKLYALDAMLGDLDEPTKAKLLRSLEGHVLESAELVGTYERTRH